MIFFHLKWRPRVSNLSENAKFAKEFLEAAHANNNNPLPPEWAQALNVAGEAGEFVEAYRRYTGNARREGSLEETSKELADVIISSYVMAERLGIDLDEHILAKQKEIMKRGFKDPRESK